MNRFAAGLALGVVLGIVLGALVGRSMRQVGRFQVQHRESGLLVLDTSTGEIRAFAGGEPRSGTWEMRYRELGGP